MVWARPQITSSAGDCSKEPYICSVDSPSPKKQGEKWSVLFCPGPFYALLLGPERECLLGWGFFVMTTGTASSNALYTLRKHLLSPHGNSLVHTVFSIPTRLVLISPGALFHKDKRGAKMFSSRRLFLMQTQKNTALLLCRLYLQFLLFILLLFSQNMLIASRCLLTCFILTTRDRKYRPDEEKNSLNNS